MRRPYFLLFLGIIGFSCSESPKNTNALEAALSSKDSTIRRVLDHSDSYEVQIRYTQIDRIADSIQFTDFDFQVDPDHYFYPASTVKFPAAVAALEKLNSLDTLDQKTRFYVEGDTTETSFEQAILEIFAVSDNAANNRLIEFLGFDDLNQRMRAKGVEPLRISHRLSTTNADDVTTKALILYKNDTSLVLSSPIVSSPPQALRLPGIEKGKGFYADDSLYQEPFDFSLKNYYPIEAQHALLKRVIFPEQFPENQRFQISEEQHRFLLSAMAALPRQAGYNNEEYFDSYGKFFIYGDTETPIPDYMNIYNKIGYAYGTLTDCAYIKDSKNQVEFLLTATLLVNADGIFNDDQYEYDQVGIPFLAQLGREIYNYELKRY
ncbi:MAG: serine hydrolase [Bacteroidota bacterium]